MDRAQSGLSSFDEEEVVVVRARQTDVCCRSEMCAAVQNESKLHRIVPRVFAWLLLGASLGLAGYVLYRRDKLFDWHRADRGQGRKPFKTFKIKPLRVSCTALQDEDGNNIDDGDTLLTQWQGGDIFANENVTLTTIQYTFGLAGLTEEEFFNNHCGYDTLRLMANPFKNEDRRKDNECRDATNSACLGGLYTHKFSENDNTNRSTEVRAAPDGYFSPEYFTCLVRCPSGAFCPASVPKQKNVADFKKCEYPKDVDKQLLAVELSQQQNERVCPGSRYVYLCPGGFRCKFSERLEPCDAGHRCPRGSASQTKCNSFMATARTLCPERKTEHPDYTIPLAVVCGCFFVVALIALAFSGLLKQAYESYQRAVRAAYVAWNLSSGKSSPNGNSTEIQRSRRRSPFSVEIRKSIARMHKSSKALAYERGIHQRILSLVSSDPSVRYAGYHAMDMSRAFFYGTLLFVLSIAFYPIAQVLIVWFLICAFIFAVVGCSGLCYVDIISAVQSYTQEIRNVVDDDEDPIEYEQIYNEREIPVVFTACGYRKSAHLIVAAASFLALCASAPWIFFVLKSRSASFFVLSVIFYGALAVFILSLCSVIALSVPHNFRPSRQACCEKICVAGVDRNEFDFRIAQIRTALQAIAESNVQRQDNEERKDSAAPPPQAMVSFGASRVQFLREGMRHRKSMLANGLTSHIDLRIDLRYKKLQVRLRGNGKIVLNNASGKIVSGNVTAILGPSGAGKTTLMSALSDRIGGYAELSGQRYVNGERVSSIRHIGRFCAFVPQDDIMLPELTVRDTLLFYAAIRSTKALTKYEIERRAVEVMELVQLRESVWDSIIGDAERRGISGGQRKRVSIAMELVSKPSLIFLDEPTSGLDATTSFQVMNALVSMAGSGCNVISVIHSPGYELFTSFSHVLLLGVGGKCVFHDDPRRVLDYFTKPHMDDGPVYECPPFANPADFVMDIISGSRAPISDASQSSTKLGGREGAADRLTELWKLRSTGVRARYGAKSNSSMRTLKAYASRPRTTSELRTLRPSRSFFVQASLFARRSACQISKRPDELLFDSALMLGFGTLFGSQSAEVTIPALPLMILWLGIGIQLFLCVAMLRVFGAERVVFWREAAQGSGMSLNISAYFWGKDLVQLPRVGLLVFCFAITFYSFVVPTASFEFYFLVLFLTGYAISGYAYILSIVLEPKAAQLFAVVVALILVLLSGIGDSTLPDLAIIPGLRILPWLSPIRWAGETLFVAETRQLSHAWKLSPNFYVNPQRDSALANLFLFGFQEGFLYVKDDGIKIEYLGNLDGTGDDEVCQISGRWMWSDLWNFTILFILGFVSRLIALCLLRNLHRDKMGEPPFTSRVAGAVSSFWSGIKELLFATRPRVASQSSKDNDDDSVQKASATNSTEDDDDDTLDESGPTDRQYIALASLPNDDENPRPFSFYSEQEEEKGLNEPPPPPHTSNSSSITTSRHTSVSFQEGVILREPAPSISPPPPPPPPPPLGN